MFSLQFIFAFSRVKMQNIIAFSVGFACIFIAVSGNTHNLSDSKNFIYSEKATKKI